MLVLGLIEFHIRLGVKLKEYRLRDPHYMAGGVIL